MKKSSVFVLSIFLFFFFLLCTRKALSQTMRNGISPEFRNGGINTATPTVNILLVHGAWVNGATWSPVISLLQRAGYNVLAPQFPLTSLADNRERLLDVLRLLQTQTRDSETGFIPKTLLVGHSYGGMIVSDLTEQEIANYSVGGIVFESALVPNEGDTFRQLLGTPPFTPIADRRGFTWVNRRDYERYFGNDLDIDIADELFAAQQPISGVSYDEPLLIEPSWRHLPTYYIVTGKDMAVPPTMQRIFFNRLATPSRRILQLADSGHLAMISHANQVFQFIMAAAKELESQIYLNYGGNFRDTAIAATGFRTGNIMEHDTLATRTFDTGFYAGGGETGMGMGMGMGGAVGGAVNTAGTQGDGRRLYTGHGGQIPHTLAI